MFNDLFVNSIVGRMDENAEIFRKILDDPEFGSAVMEHYLLRVVERARSSDAPVASAAAG